jgi:hypothetical protein
MGFILRLTAAFCVVLIVTEFEELDTASVFYFRKQTIMIAYR